MTVSALCCVVLCCAVQCKDCKNFPGSGERMALEAKGQIAPISQTFLPPSTASALALTTAVAHSPSQRRHLSTDSGGHAGLPTQLHSHSHLLHHPHLPSSFLPSSSSALSTSSSAVDSSASLSSALRVSLTSDVLLDLTRSLLLAAHQHSSTAEEGGAVHSVESIKSSPLSRPPRLDVSSPLLPLQDSDQAVQDLLLLASPLHIGQSHSPLSFAVPSHATLGSAAAGKRRRSDDEGQREGVGGGNSDEGEEDLRRKQIKLDALASVHAAIQRAAQGGQSNGKAGNVSGGVGSATHTATNGGGGGGEGEPPHSALQTLPLVGGDGLRPLESLLCTESNAELSPRPPFSSGGDITADAVASPPVSGEAHHLRADDAEDSESSLEEGKEAERTWKTAKSTKTAAVSTEEQRGKGESEAALPSLHSQPHSPLVMAASNASNASNAASSPPLSRPSLLPSPSPPPPPSLSPRSTSSSSSASTSTLTEFATFLKRMLAQRARVDDYANAALQSSSSSSSLASHPSSPSHSLHSPHSLATLYSPRSQRPLSAPLAPLNPPQQETHI